MCHAIYRCMVKIQALLMEDETPALNKSQLFRNRASERVKRRAPSKDGDGSFILNRS